MFEDAPEFIVLICLFIDMAITVSLAVLAVKWHRRYQFLKVENSMMLKRAQILQTSNDMLKELVVDLKSRASNASAERDRLVRENRGLSDKLSSTQKRLSNFSKMINDMKDS